MVAVYADDDDFADPDDDEDVAHKCCSVLPRFMNMIMMMEDRGTGYDDYGSNDDDGGNDDDDDDVTTISDKGPSQCSLS